MLQEKTNNNETKTIWASISNGSIVVKSDANDPKAVSRINKMGNQTYERFYTSIFGMIKTIEVEENKFGETDIKIGLEDEDNKSILTFKLNSSYGRAFLSQIFNADLSRKIQFTPWTKTTEEGQKKTRLYLSYGVRNSSIEWKLPEGTPEVKFVDVKGKKVIDNISQITNTDFLVEKLNELITTKGLTYKAEKVDLGQNVDISEPTAEELKELNKLKRANKKVNETSKANSNDDNLFDLF